MAKQTPKEKAEELFSNYRFLLSIPNAPLGESKDNIAKQCALMAVNEMISVLNQDANPLANYWYKVKEEIEKL